jgi:nickel transport protein
MKRASRLLIALGLLLSPPLQAHLLKVFAFTEGNRIEGSVYFVGGAPATGATVQVRSAEGRLLAELMPDNEGEFSYVAKAKTDHLIEADTGDGHVAQWTVPAVELTGETIAPDATDEEPSTASTSESEGPGAPVRSGGATEANTDELAALVERAVARQVRPLREQLIAYEERVRLRDIVGGLGYIIGLAGLTAWWQQRRGSRDR